METLFREMEIVWARPRIANYPSAEANALEKERRNRIEGEVRFEDGSHALYATDSSNYRQVPIGVVISKTTEDVLATVEACRRFSVPFLARGGTSSAGQSCNVVVVLDFTKYLKKLIDLDLQANDGLRPAGHRVRLAAQGSRDDLAYRAQELSASTGAVALGALAYIFRK